MWKVVKSGKQEEKVKNQSWERAKHELQLGGIPYESVRSRI